MNAQVGRNPKGQDNKDWLGAEHEHAVAGGHALNSFFDWLTQPTPNQQWLLSVADHIRHEGEK